jgi:outer membrane lipoprotein-sorting protein
MSTSRPSSRNDSTSSSANGSAPADGRRLPLTLLAASLALLVLRGSSCLEVKPPYKRPTAKEVVAALRVRAARVRAIRGETRMNHKTDQGKVKATVRMMASQGGKLRFDAVSPFDTPLATLVTNGDRFALVDAQKNRHYHGPASPCNIARLLQVAMQPDDMLTVLGGSTPIIEHESATVEWDGRAFEEVLTLRGKQLTQKVRLDATNRRWDLRRSEIRDAKGLLLSIKASDYKIRGGLRLPQRIKVEQPRNKAQLDVTFKQQEVNVKLPAAAFQLPEARGMPSQRVECTTVIKQ